MELVQNGKNDIGTLKESSLQFNKVNINYYLKKNLIQAMCKSMQQLISDITSYF